MKHQELKKNKPIILEKVLYSSLKQGDIFQWGDKPWDEINRFFACRHFDDEKQIWVDKPTEKTRTCTSLLGLFTSTSILMFTWHHKEYVFIVKLPISDWKKSIGKPYYPGNGEHRYFFNFTPNPINIQTS